MSRKAYHVEQSRKGVSWLLVYADSVQEARRKVLENHPDAEMFDYQDEPGGVRRVRRAPEEDPSAPLDRP